MLPDGPFGRMYTDFNEGTMHTRADRPAHERIGPAFRWSKVHQHDQLSSETYRQYNLEIHHLLGDPMMRLRLPELSE